MPTLEQAIHGYRVLRDHKKKLEDEHKERIAPINDKMKKIEAWLLNQLISEGADHIGTLSGTVYKSTIVKPVIKDWSATLQFIIDNELWGMLEHRISKAAVEEYMESVGAAPPGVEISSETFARIRK